MNFNDDEGTGRGISGNASNQPNDERARQLQSDEAQGNEKKRRVEVEQFSGISVSPAISQQSQTYNASQGGQHLQGFPPSQQQQNHHILGTGEGMSGDVVSNPPPDFNNQVGHFQQQLMSLPNHSSMAAVAANLQPDPLPTMPSDTARGPPSAGAGVTAGSTPGATNQANSSSPAGAGGQLTSSIPSIAGIMPTPMNLGLPSAPQLPTHGERMSPQMSQSHMQSQLAALRQAVAQNPMLQQGFPPMPPNFLPNQYLHHPAQVGGMLPNPAVFVQQQHNAPPVAFGTPGLQSLRQDNTPYMTATRTSTATGLGVGNTGEDTTGSAAHSSSAAEHSLEPAPTNVATSVSGSVGTAAAAKAPLAPPPPDQREHNPRLSGRPPITLFMSCDDDSLSEYQCLVRKQIELFEARKEEVESNAKGRNKPIVLGQVGIRCRHCSMLPPKHRSRGAMYYPAKLNGLYQAAQSMASGHLCYHCQHIHPDIRQELMILKERKSSAGSGKKYWGDGVRALGVFEDDDGLRFKK